MKINKYLMPALRIHVIAKRLVEINRQLKENARMERFIARVWLIVLLLVSIGAVAAFAYPAGECVSLDPEYKFIAFRAEEFLNLEGAVEFQKMNRGQLIQEHGKDQWYVIWNPSIPAPTSAYQCVHISGE